MKEKKTMSLKTGLLSMIVLCWIIPIILVMTVAGFLLGRSYQESAKAMVRSSADYAFSQVQRQLKRAVEDSKGVSYDGVIRNAYRHYEQRQDSAELYRRVDDYINQQFARSNQYRAVFVRFWDEDGTGVYLLNSGTTGFGLLQECKKQSETILEEMRLVDTDIRTLAINGNLYLTRNLLDSHFKPYATVVLLLDSKLIFSPLDSLNGIVGAQISIDDLTFFLGESDRIIIQDKVDLNQADLCYQVEADNHVFSFSADFQGYSLLKENPWLLAVAMMICLMVLPMVILVIYLFQKNVSRPMSILTRASRYVQSGERGYQITADSPNQEFEKLIGDFNVMSSELKKQFDRAYLEQQATQKAQIKALQSQINPHFLNNTLEVINWEARIAGNDHVSEMIEALSTMLSAALDRKGRTQIPLEEELGYVDAYLRIIRWRVGDKFLVHKDIDEDVLSLAVPRLILQPIAENAVEHDITPRRGGNLWLRAFREEGYLAVEVEHDGSLTDEDVENIKKFLAPDVQGTHVGIQNVSQRLKLIYGVSGLLTIEATDHDTIVAKLRFPLDRSTKGIGE